MVGQDTQAAICDHFATDQLTRPFQTAFSSDTVCGIVAPGTVGVATNIGLGGVDVDACLCREGIFSRLWPII